MCNNHRYSKMILSKEVACVVLLLFTVHHINTRLLSDPILFDFHRRQKLTILNGNGTKSLLTQVKNNMSCLGECIRITWCQSCNFKTTPESTGLHVCELLFSDRFTKGNSLLSNETFHHYNLKVQYDI